MGEYTYGVCYYEFDGYNAKPKNLITYESYDKAYQDYIKRLSLDDKPTWINPNLWIIWIRNI